MSKIKQYRQLHASLEDGLYYIPIKNSKGGSAKAELSKELLDVEQTVDYDWNGFRDQLLAAYRDDANYVFSVLRAEMPIHPPAQLVTGVTSGIEPRCFNLFKKDSN